MIQLGGVWEDNGVVSDRHLFPHLDINATGSLSDGTILELWSLLKACEFQGKSQGSKLQLISVDFSS